MVPTRSENATSTISMVLAFLLRLAPGEQPAAPAFRRARIDLENGETSAALADAQAQQRHSAGLVIHLDQLNLLASERAGELVQTTGRVHAARSTEFRHALWHPPRGMQITDLDKGRILPSGRCGIPRRSARAPLHE